MARNSDEMRVTLDSVILVSAFISRGGLAAELLDYCLDAPQIEICLSQEILSETRQTLLTKRHLRNRFSYSEDNVDEFLAALEETVTMVHPPSDIHVVERDPDDNPILATALASDANYLVSRDADLLDLGDYKGVVFISPEEFMPILRSRSAD